MKYLLLCLMMVGKAFGALPTTNLIANYKASVGITIVGAGVDTWEDQTVNGYNLRQTTDASRPVVRTTDGLDSIFFNNKYMTHPAGLTLDKRDSSMFICYRTVDGGNSNYLNIGDLGITINKLSEQIYSYQPSARASGIFVEGGKESTGLINGASAATIYNGSETGVLPVAPEESTSGAGFIGLHALPNVSDLEDTHVYEIAIYSAALSEADRNAVFDYFSETYGAISRTEDTFFLFEGDSLTAGNVGLPIPIDDNYTAALGRLYTTETKKRNIAAGSDTIQAMAADTTVAEAVLARQSNYSTHYAVLWAGMNDIIASRSSAQIIADLDSWISTIRAADAGINIVGCTLTPTGTLDAGEEIIRLAVNVHILGDMDTDLTIDLANVSELSNPANTTYYNVDTVHHNVAGTDIVAQTVYDALNPSTTGGIRGRYTDGYRTNYRPRYN